MGSTSGSITLQEPAVAGTTIIDFPATSGNAVVDAATQTLTNKTLGSGLVMNASPVTRGTAVASTSGSAIDFTGIPNWVKRITIMLNGVSLNGTDSLLVQLGDAGGFEATGYASANFQVDGTTSGFNNSTTGFLINSNNSSSYLNSGNVVITNISGNNWVCSSLINGTGSSISMASGAKTLSDVLTQVRIDTSGTNTFDAGSINILYE
jgi:hypothetical protein